MMNAGLGQRGVSGKPPLVWPPLVWPPLVWPPLVWPPLVWQQGFGEYGLAAGDLLRGCFLCLVTAGVSNLNETSGRRRFEPQCNKFKFKARPVDVGLRRAEVASEKVGSRRTQK
jgi:hypothetical protein